MEAGRPDTCSSDLVSPSLEGCCKYASLGCREIVLLSARLRFVFLICHTQSNHGLQLLLFLSFSMNK